MIHSFPYDEDRDGRGTLRLFVRARGPRDAINAAWEDWDGDRRWGWPALIGFTKDDLEVWPEDREPQTGWRDFVVRLP